MNEEFRVVPGYPDYSVSNKGVVISRKRIKPKRLSLLKTGGKDQYYGVSLGDGIKQRRFYVHQLVAMAFLGHVRDGYNKVIDHVDGNRFNNNLSNLRIVSHRDNITKRKDRRKHTGVRENQSGNKYTASIHINGKLTHLGSSFNTPEEASDAYKEKRDEITNP